MPGESERLDSLETWRRQVESRHKLTTVVEYVGRLIDESEYRARFMSDRQRGWRRWKLRIAVTGGGVAVASSVVSVIVQLTGWHA